MRACMTPGHPLPTWWDLVVRSCQSSIARLRPDRKRWDMVIVSTHGRYAATSVYSSPGCTTIVHGPTNAEVV